MESIAMRTISFSIPVKDTGLVREIARKMGWVVLPQPKQRKSSYERSRDDIKGSGKPFNKNNLTSTLDM